MKIQGKRLERIKYSQLNARQKEQFNFQKASAVLADYGFATFKIGDDWNGADFFAQHASLDIYLKIQLKSRLAFDKKYLGKNLYGIFQSDDKWYLYPHDECLEKVSQVHNMKNTASWRDKGGYNFPSLSRELSSVLGEYLIESRAHA